MLTDKELVENAIIVAKRILYKLNHSRILICWMTYVYKSNIKRTVLLMVLVLKSRSFISYLCKFLRIYDQLLFKPSTCFQIQSSHTIVIFTRM